MGATAGRGSALDCLRVGLTASLPADAPAATASTFQEPGLLLHDAGEFGRIRRAFGPRRGAPARQRRARGLDVNMFKLRHLATLALCAFGAAGCTADDPDAPEMAELLAPADVGAPPADAERSDSGLVSKRLVVGQGARFPTATDVVRVHYTGWKNSGELFDTSLDGPPLEIGLDRVIAGWTEGLQLMVEGEKRRFWIPEYLAYGGRREPLGGLVFDVELIAIVGR
jgi:hypothetical protein